MTDLECLGTLIGIKLFYSRVGATPEAIANIEGVEKRFRTLLNQEYRFITLLLDTAQRWNIYAAANQEHPEKVAAGEAVDQVCRELAKEVQALTERPEPTEAEPSAEPSPG